MHNGLSHRDFIFAHKLPVMWRAVDCKSESRLAHDLIINEFLSKSSLQIDESYLYTHFR